jgi:hypothetical protein
MTPPDELLHHDLETLRRGGVEAIALFMQTSKVLHEEQSDDALRAWLAVAGAALTDADRTDVFAMLMYAFFHKDDAAGPRTAAVRTAGVARVLH